MPREQGRGRRAPDQSAARSVMTVIITRLTARQSVAISMTTPSNNRRPAIVVLMRPDGAMLRRGWPLEVTFNRANARTFGSEEEAATLVGLPLEFKPAVVLL